MAKDGTVSLQMCEHGRKETVFGWRARYHSIEDGQTFQLVSTLEICDLPEPLDEVMSILRSLLQYDRPRDTVYRSQLERKASA